MLNKLNLVEHTCVASVFENEVKSIHHNGKEDAKYSGYSLVKPRGENPTNITHITIIRALTHLGYSNINNTWTNEHDISPLISAFRFGLPPVNSSSFTVIAYLDGLVPFSCSKHDHYCRRWLLHECMTSVLNRCDNPHPTLINVCSSMWKINEHLGIHFQDTTSKLNDKNSPDVMTIVMANNPISYNIGKPGQRVRILPELERIEEFRNQPIHA